MAVEEQHKPEAKGIEALEALLPPPPNPIGSYVPVVQTGNLVLTSGCLPMKDGKLAYSGAVGGIYISLAEGQDAARQCILNALSAIKAHLGSLHRIKRVVKITGFVNSAPGFYEQPTVINGASNFLTEYLGEVGKHARSAVGVSALPLDASVEIEMIVEVQL